MEATFGIETARLAHICSTSQRRQRALVQAHPLQARLWHPPSSFFLPCLSSLKAGAVQLPPTFYAP